MKQSELGAFVDDGTVCPTCGRDDFASERGLKQHHARTHGESLTALTLTCENCGEGYERYPKDADGSRFCSRECKHEGMQGEGHPNHTVKQRPCSHCGDAVETTRSERRRFENHFCDSDCMYAFQTGENHPNANRDTRPCTNCGKSVTRCITHFNEYPMCSRECYGEWLSEHRVGEDHHQWTRERSECEHCGAEIWRKQHQFDGRNHFCDYECLGEWHSEHRYAENHPQWRGGYGLTDTLRRSLGERSWQSYQRTALGRAGGECEMCGGTAEQALDVHHIIPLLYGGVNGDWNLIALCKPCHGTVERYTDSLLDPVLTE